ncbi:MAG: GTP-binding protein [Prochlorotrichaceae cyanobacterium]
MRSRPSIPSSLPPDLALEVTYRQTQKTLHTLRTSWVKSPRERSQLEGVLRGLGRMQAKLESRLLQIAVLGLVGQGKSSLLNALLGESRFQTGALHGVTRQFMAARWTLPEVDLPLNVELWDTPGLDEVNGEQRSRLARRVAQRADLILFVVAGDLTDLECEVLQDLRRSGKPILLVFNKVDQYSQTDRDALYAKIQTDRLPDWIATSDIVMTAAAPLKRSLKRREDGQMEVHHQLSLPQVEALKTRIYEILKQDGLALLTLNGLLYGQAAQTRMLECKLSLRETAVEELIWKSAITKALAVAINPIAVLDILGGTIVDVNLILSLARLYGLPLTRWEAWRLLRAIGISAAALSAGEFMTHLGLGSLKGFLSAGLAPTGGASLAPYISVAVTQGAIAGTSAYAVGQVAKRYLAEGGNGQADLNQAIDQVLQTLERDSVLSRLQGELQRQLPPRPPVPRSRRSRQAQKFRATTAPKRTYSP